MDNLGVFLFFGAFIELVLKYNHQVRLYGGGSMISKINQNAEVEKTFTEAIAAGKHLIKFVEKISSHPDQIHNIQLNRMYLALGRTQILYIEALQKGYQNYLKERRGLFCTKAKDLKVPRESIAKDLSDAEEIEELLKVGIKIIETYDEMDSARSDLRWLARIDQLWHNRDFMKKYKIEQPRAMKNQIYERYVEELSIHEKMLRMEEGWDQQAVLGYFQQISTRLKNTETTQTMLEELSILKDETKKVGSTLYTTLFNASTYTDREKMALVMQHLQARIDSDGMLQLKGPYQLDPEMPPHSLFLESFAQSVTKAYPNGLVPKNNPTIPALTLKIIHQFRMYIDRQNINYIRTHYSGVTDLDKLLAYGKQQRLSFCQTSRLHNRFSAEYPFKGQVNDKITTKNGLSEFIVDVTTGDFVTQWDVLEVKESEIGIFSDDYHPNTLQGKAIVETESFNYSNQAKMHQLFDVDPAGAHHGLEHSIKIAAKKYWKSGEWRFLGGNYFERYKKKSDYPYLKARKKIDRHSN